MAGVSAASPDFLAPEPLGPRHDLSAFSNGIHASLDHWLRGRTRASEDFSARTYVLCTADMPLRVVGYFAISTALEERIVLLSARLRQGMPAKIPLLLIGRLAVDARFQRRGVGSALLVNALERCLAASEIVGARGVIAHAIDDSAVRFYARHGFVHSPLGERIMLMPIETVRSLLMR